VGTKADFHTEALSCKPPGGQFDEECGWAALAKIADRMK